MNFSELDSKLDPEKRYHFTHQDLILSDERKPKHGGLGKPLGLWYSFGNAWSEWVIGEEYGHDGYTQLYEIEVDESRVLQISSTEDIINIVKTYKGVSEFEGVSILQHEVSWEKVSKDYSGVEINPLRRHIWMDLNLRKALNEDNGWAPPPMFIMIWDVSSGCVWDTSIIKYKLVAVNDNDGWRFLDENDVVEFGPGPNLALNA